jgi:hypothetical protein
MTPEQQQQAIDKIKAHDGAKNCPHCNHDEWGMNPDLGVLMALGSLTVGVPVVFLACRRCGFVKLFVAATLGVSHPSMAPLPQPKGAG